MDWNSFEFAHPYLAILAPAPLLVWLFWPRSETRKSFTALRTHHFSHWNTLASHTRQSSRVLVLLLMIIIWASLVIAIMRPQVIGDPLEEPQKGRSIMLAVDLSGSMVTKDVYLNNQQLSRFELVQKVMGQFIDRREGDRLGLIFFGTRPYLQAPLTADLKAVREYLDTAFVRKRFPYSRREESLIEGYTHISRAVGLGIKELKNVDAEHRVLLLLTDGEPSEGDLDHNDVANIAKENGVKVYTIGFKGVHGGFAANDVVLKDYSRVTGGKYFFAQSGDGLKQAYQAFDKLEPFSAKPQVFRLNRDIFYWPLGLALLLSLAVGFMKSREHV